MLIFERSTAPVNGFGAALAQDFGFARGGVRVGCCGHGFPPRRTLAIVKMSRSAERWSREPLDAVSVIRWLAHYPSGTDGAPWPVPRLLATTGSTNAELAVVLAAGPVPEGTCVVAEHQSAGKGRQGRVWESPAGAGLWLSVVIDIAAVAPARRGLLPLAAGLALADALIEVTGLEVMLKWPNDIVIDGPARDGLVGPRKLGGLLVEAAERAVVGCGINVSGAVNELPTPQATSLFLEGAPPVDRGRLLAAELSHLRHRVTQWRAGLGLIGDYRERCLSLGRSVQVLLPGGEVLVGVATAISPDGQLVVTDSKGNSRSVAAGDVIHATI
ncbi:MAG: biotin--[acetyl-CoA-carboxylase] ligase [Actinobacteria bacterium]|nr:MAG: biotin--[acetyl-CoA-carboxylase] ligase [Actinomycetota bacterium]